MLSTLCALLVLGGAVAIPSQETSLPLDPVAAHLRAAQDAYASEALGEAHDQLQAALALAPGEPELRQWMARVLNDLGHHAEALEVLEPALSVLPRSAWLLFERSRAERGLHNFAAAEQDLRTALEVYPGFDAARIEWVALLLERGSSHAAQALEVLGPLLERQASRPRVILLQAEGLTLASRGEEAEALLRAHLDSSDVRLACCRYLAKHERLDEAWAVGEPLVLEVTDPLDRTLLAQVAHRAGKPLLALQLLSAVLLEDATQPVALAELTSLLEQPAALNAAVCARRLEASPEDPRVWVDLCEDLLRSGNDQELLDRCAQLPGTLQGNDELRLLQGQALRHLDRGAEAQALLQPLANDGNPRANYELGLIEYAQGRYQTAAERFEVGASGAWAADASFNRGICLDRLKNHEGAASAYRAATVQRPEFAEAWLQLGHALRLRLGQADEARAAYRRYLDLGGDDPEVRRLLGEKP